MTTTDKPALTTEQSLPLGVRGASVALSAGAGCGKTTVLTERFLGALAGDGQDRRALATIVALTFTEKAARELRQRIRRACHERLATSPSEQVAFWRTTLRGLEAAPVTTFHEYCASLLRRHNLLAGIDADFEVLDANLAGTVLEETADRCVRRWLAEQNADLIELAVELGLHRVREALADLVRSRDAHAITAWTSRPPEDLVAVWEAAWEAQCIPILIGRVVDAARRCSVWMNAHPFKHAKLAAFRSGLLAALSDVERCTETEDGLESLRALAMLPRGLRKADWPSLTVNEEAKEVLESLRDTIDDVKKSLERDPAADLQAAEHGLRFARLSAEARAEFERAKLARGGLDFDDLLLRTRALLEDHADAVRNDPGRPVEFVLVDEFQDTDPIQSDILRRLAGAGFASGGLFVVGDFKQSIYRFRGAQPRLFQEYRAGFPAEGRLELSENFRATTHLIEFVNALFHDAFPGENARLLPGPAAQPPGAGPSVEFVWPVEESTEEPSSKPSAHELRQVEARWLARVVHSRLEEGWPVRIRGSRTGQVRQAHAGDVAFLFRAMTDVAPYEQALAEEGLDFHVVGGSAFYAQQEVQDLVNVLSVIEDPCDAVSLAGTLRGPIVGLSDDALYRLGGSGRGDLPARFASVDDVAGLSETDQHRAERARALLEQWRALKDRVPIATLVDRVLDDSGYEAALPGEFLGERKRANARKLVRLARTYDARGGFTLAHFVARLRDDLREPPREGQAATTDEEGTSVRLMSIHQAKGLEFPIVVVPDLNRKSEGAKRAVTFDVSLGPLVRLNKATASTGDDEPKGQSLGWIVSRTLERREDDAESVRLFYVATTRARDALILSAGGGAAVNPVSPALRLLAERFDRATGNCLAELPAGWNRPEVGVIRDLPPPGALRTPRRNRRVSPGAVARIIVATPLRKEPIPPLRSPRPRRLDLDDAANLAPRAARLAGLIRSALADPAALKLSGLAGAVRRAAARQVPQATRELEDEAQRRLARHLHGPIADQLAGATKLERGAEWMLVWPPGTGDATVVHGRAEFVLRDADGVWTVVTFSPPGMPEPLERLRWLLSARAAAARGLAPIGPGWRIDLSDDGGSRGEESGSDAQLDLALDRTLEAINATWA